MQTGVKGKILICEDEDFLRESLVDILTQIGLNVIAASNGKEALTLLEKYKFDVVVSDINMPEMNGIEFLKEVRSKGLDLPFIFLTAYCDNENALKALRLGAFDFIEKPCDLTDLERTIQDALERTDKMQKLEISLCEGENQSTCDLKIKEIQEVRKNLNKSRYDFQIKEIH